ncbi:MAG: DUF222 domain-containing protein [Actinomycetota bacterium]
MEEARDNRHAELTDAIEQMSAVRATLDRQLLALVLECERSEVWKVDGSASIVDWVALRMGLSRSAARRCVEAAHALEVLPAIAAEMDAGSLTLDQVCVLIDFVTPDDDEYWAERARGMTVAQLKAWRRSVNQVSTEDANKDHEQRSLHWYWDTDKRFLHIKGALPAEQGAVVDKALLRIAGAMPMLPNGIYDTWERRGADALVELASTVIAEDADPDRATIVIHVEADALTADEGAAAIEGGCEIAPETVRRLACDASIQIVSRRDGHSLGVGRKTRTPPPWLRRLTRKRDVTCRFPGCNRKHHLHTHHVKHWTPQRGPTDLDNLLMLCPYHHRLVHEGGWTIRGKPDGDLVFVRPDRLEHVPKRPRLRSDIRQRVYQSA